ncbi:MAG: hypothetical protein ACLQIB_58665 [Isosphaeraceae bacterium]
MSMDATTSGPSHTPLEEFLRAYAEVVGGVWDEVEPQVYDLMLPAAARAREAEIVRLVFDPEAIPEHPGAQLASYGTPLVDSLLADAVNRGRHVVLYLVGLNLAPQGLEDRLRRAATLPAGFELKLDHCRTLHFPQAALWFEATFVSDQKEQDLLTVAIDVHHGRQVRHLERLLDRAHLADKPWTPLAEVQHPGLASAYPVARDRVVRTLSAMANTYHRELGERLHRQLERIKRYYTDLRTEVEEQAQKARNRGEEAARFAERLEALAREESLRSAELKRKSQLKVQLRLLNLLVIHQPKQLLRAAVVSKGSVIDHQEWVWDPLIEAIEATVCPECRRPTFEFGVTRQMRLVCPACAAAPSAPARITRR